MYQRLLIVGLLGVEVIAATILGKPVRAEVKKTKAGPAPQHQIASSKGAGKQPAKKANPTQSKSGLTDIQKAAAEAALKSLRKLDAATEVGVSLTDYQSRLIDTKADVNEGIRALPDGQIKIDLNDSMQAHQDASTFWHDCIQLKNRVDILNGASGSILKKYDLTLPQVGKKESDAEDKVNADYKVAKAAYDKIKDTDQEDLKDKTLASMDELIKEALNDLGASLNINDEDEKRILSAIWKVASQKERDAETALK